MKLALTKEPKWITHLRYLVIDSATGEYLGFDKLETNSHKSTNHSKIKAMDAFSDAYSDLYRKRKVTMLFHTFTRATASEHVWSDFIQLVLKRYQRLGLPVLGYVWVLEVGKRTNMVHYHLAVTINRTRFKTIPESLKLDSIWGQRTQIDFVKKNIRHYLAKYFAKNDSRVLDLDSGRTLRSLGKSKTFKIPE